MPLKGLVVVEVFLRAWNAELCLELLLARVWCSDVLEDQGCTFLIGEEGSKGMGCTQEQDVQMVFWCVRCFCSMFRCGSWHVHYVSLLNTPLFVCPYVQTITPNQNR